VGPAAFWLLQLHGSGQYRAVSQRDRIDVSALHEHDRPELIAVVVHNVTDAKDPGTSGSASGPVHKAPSRSAVSHISLAQKRQILHPLKHLSSCSQPRVDSNRDLVASSS